MKSKIFIVSFTFFLLSYITKCNGENKIQSLDTTDIIVHINIKVIEVDSTRMTPNFCYCYFHITKWGTHKEVAPCNEFATTYRAMGYRDDYKHRAH
jgi:hypothetical protein